MKITSEMIDVALAETPFIPNDGNRVWMKSALTAALSSCLGDPNRDDPGKENGGADPVGYVTAGDLTVLRHGASCVDLFRKPVDGFPSSAVYAHPPVQPSVGVPVKVKLLEWNPLEAMTPFGKYRVSMSPMANGFYGAWFIGNRVGEFGSRDEAKAAAQQDYQERVLSALSTVAAQDDLERMRRALEPFAEEAACYDPDEGDGDEPLWATPVTLTIRDLRNARAALSRDASRDEERNAQ